MIGFNLFISSSGSEPVPDLVMNPNLLAAELALISLEDPRLHNPCMARNTKRILAFVEVASNGIAPRDLADSLGNINLCLASPGQRLALLKKFLDQPELADPFGRPGVSRVLRSFGGDVVSFLKTIDPNELIEGFNYRQIKPRLVELRDELKGALKPPTAGKVANDMRYDNTLFGLDGVPFDAKRVNYLDIAPAGVNFHGSVKSANWLFVNGINTTLEEHMADVQQLGERIGQPLIGLHYGTSGEVKTDVRRALRERAVGMFGGRLATFLKSPLIGTLAKQLQEALNRGEDPKIIAVSNGAFLVSQAIELLKRRLAKSNTEPEQVLQRVSLVTFGGASFTYPDGPKYTHHINTADPVPFVLGVADAGEVKASFDPTAEHFQDSIAGKVLTTTSKLLPKDLVRHAGAGAVFYTFDLEGPECHSPHTYIQKLEFHT